MKLEIVNTSVVILANGLEPSTLHPGYLESWRIAQKDWILAQPPINTPILSTVAYTNGMTFTLEPGKLQIMDSNPPTENFSNSPVAHHMTKYLQKLSGIEYTAVGINIVGFLERADADVFLVQNFLKPRSGRSHNLRPESMSLKLVYSVSDARLTLACDPGTAKVGEQTDFRAGVLVSANYHTDIRDGSQKAAKRAISRFQVRCTHFAELVEDVLVKDA